MFRSIFPVRKRALEVIWGASHAALVRDFDGAQLAALDPGLLRLVISAQNISASELQAAYAEMRALSQKMQSVSPGLRSAADADRSHHRFRCRRRHARRHALPAMVRLDAADMAVQSHPPACRLGALRLCRGAADRVADRGADVQRAEHPPREPLRRAGLRHRRAAGPWRGWPSSHGKTIAMIRRDDRVEVRGISSRNERHLRPAIREGRVRPLLGSLHHLQPDLLVRFHRALAAAMRGGDAGASGPAARAATI